VQSGKPVAVFRSHADAPRVLIANSNLVPKWATIDEFRRLEGLGLTMYGQMTAGSWIYIGTQGILQGTYETLAECARQHFGGTLAGTLTVTAGLGGMGGAQPLAVTMNGGVCLVAEVDGTRIDKRLATRYLDERAVARRRHRPRSRRARGARGGLHRVEANAVDLLAALVERGVVPEVLTDQTSAHDNLNGYVPHGVTLDEAVALRATDPQQYIRRAMASMAEHVRCMLELQRRGAVTFDYGNNLRGQALEAGVADAFDHRRLRAAVHPAAVLRRQGPFRWAVLSGDPDDLPAPTRRFSSSSRTTSAAPLDPDGAASGSPSRVCRRASAGSATASARRPAGASTSWWRQRRVSAPIVIGRDHLDCGSVASPNRETEGCATAPTPSPTGRS
jgi:urocanate hydratase